MRTGNVPIHDQEQPLTIVEIFDDPDDIGAVECRAVYEILEGLNISEPGEAVEILEETIAWANHMITQIRERYHAA